MHFLLKSMNMPCVKLLLFWRNCWPSADTIIRQGFSWSWSCIRKSDNCHSSLKIYNWWIVFNPFLSKHMLYCTFCIFLAGMFWYFCTWVWENSLNGYCVNCFEIVVPGTDTMASISWESEACTDTCTFDISFVSNNSSSLFR